MAKMEWSSSEPGPQSDGTRLLATLAAHALGMAIIARAEIKLLRQMLAEHDVELDEKAFQQACRVHQADLLNNYRKKHPDIAHAIPSLELLMERGIFTLDP